MALITIGNDAINRTSTTLAAYTYVDQGNPANDTSSLTSFEIWMNSTGSGVKVGTFSGGGVNYNNRDGETIGAVASGSKQTFSGLDYDVTVGDFIGFYATGGRCERSTSGYTSFGWKSGDQFGAGLQTYSIDAGDAISVYGTGSSGWSGKIAGVSSPASVGGVLAANIASVKGVA